MDILQINTVDTKGGAAKVAHRLQIELQNKQHTAHLLVSRRYSENSSIDRFPSSRLRRSLNRRLHLHERIYQTRSFLTSHSWFQEADVVHYHNLHGDYFNILDLPALTQAKPSVMTLHDPWIIQEAGLTPEYNTIFEQRSEAYKKNKQHSIKNASLTFVAPSEWLAKKVRQIYPQNVKIIPNGIDTTLFKSQDKQRVRQILGLPANTPLILCVAASGSKNTSKGFSDINNLLHNPLLSSALFLVIGGDEAETNHPNIRYVPYIQDEAILAQYYAAADICLFLSRAENLPLTILESLACGTPVISYTIGGIPEMIKHQETGYLAEPQNEVDLVYGINLFLAHDPQTKQRISEAARDAVEARYTLAAMTDAYLALYQEIYPPSHA